MRQVVITQKGLPEVLKVCQAAEPAPGPGCVRIRVATIGVNFADLMMRLGLYPDAPPLPAVPGYEVAGVVDAVGYGVTERAVGDRVLAMTQFGGYSEAVCVPAQLAYRLPTGIPPDVGAALPVNYLTAYQMLAIMARVGPADSVLVHGAAGGVGLAAVQICRLRGARVLGSASPAKHDFLREHGVDSVFDSRQTHFAPAIKAATGGRGVDIVLEPRHGRWIKESYQALAKTGRLIMFGFSSAAHGKAPSRFSALKTLAQIPWLQLNPLRLMNDNKALAGVNLGRMWDQQERVTVWMDQLLTWLGDGHIAPRVDRVFPLAEAAAAHHYLHDRRNIGKVILATGQGAQQGDTGP
jgi:NADPH:quinone reductase-like Zn-dependent oxidoreductase